MENNNEINAEFSENNSGEEKFEILESNDNKITIKKVLLGFLLCILSYIISSAIGGFFISILNIFFKNSFYFHAMLGGLLILALNIFIFIFLSNKALKLSYGKSALLFLIEILVIIGVFAAVCGGILLIFS